MQKEQTAAILEAEGRKGADINQAEGEKRRASKAEGEAQARLAVAGLKLRPSISLSGRNVFCRPDSISLP